MVRQMRLTRLFGTWLVPVCLCLAVMVLGSRTQLRGQIVKVVVSSQAGDRLSPKPNLHFGGKADLTGPSFAINDGVTYQKIDGFGASILEAGLICIRSLPADKQEVVLRSLFDAQQGAGFSAMKTVIGATDFMSAGPFYTYDDTPGDVAMQHFSIARDLGPDGEIIFINRARQYGNFTLQAPMDYPPDWMLIDAQSRKKQDVSPKYYDALARYYLRYVQEYEKNGVVLDYLSLFNEPGVYTRIPYDEIRELLKNHVGPLFEKEGIKTRIQLSEAPTRETANQNYHIALDDPQARKYVGGLAYHGYDWTNPEAFKKIAEVHAKYPDLPMWMTEVCHAYEIGEPKSMPMPRYDFEDGDLWGNMIMSDLEAGASAWIYWNMITDEKGGPWLVSVIHGDPDPNAQHPVVIVNRQTHQVSYTGLYYYLAHFSKFVRPGDHRVETRGGAEKVRCMAFKAPQGGIIVQLLNSGAQPAQVRVAWHDMTLPVNLPGMSISTLMW